MSRGDTEVRYPTSNITLWPGDKYLTLTIPIYLLLRPPHASILEGARTRIAYFRGFKIAVVAEF